MLMNILGNWSIKFTEWQRDNNAHRQLWRHLIYCRQLKRHDFRYSSHWQKSHCYVLV